MAREMKDSGIAWIGNIPSTWKTNAAFQIFTQVKNKNVSLLEQNLLSLSYGRIKRKDIEATDGLLPESFDAYNIVEKGDIVLRLTDLQNDQRSLRVGLVTERGIITSAYLTIRNHSESLVKYLYYYLHAFDISKGFYGMGSGVRQGLNWDGIKRLEILSPPVAEQMQIADFLDAKCTRIDAVMEQIGVFIEECKKLKQTVITQAMGKGIQPSRPVKSSDFFSFGDLPAAWDVFPLTKCMESIVDYRGKTPEKQSCGTLLVTARNIKDGKIDYENSKEYVRTEEYESIMHRGKIEVGDVLFTTEAPLGSVANADRTDFALAQRIIKFRGQPRLLNNYFLKYWMMSSVFQQSLISLSTGSTAKGIKASKLRLLKVVLPPLDEQEEIVTYLDSELRKIDNLIKKMNSLLKELSKYRQAIIYEYVTGKKEIMCHGEEI